MAPGVKPPDSQMIAQALPHSHCSALYASPSLLEGIAKDSTLANCIEHVSAILTGGGPLPTSTGNALTTSIEILPVMGATEFAALPQLTIGVADDWQYLCIHPWMSAHFRQHSDNLYEMVLVRDEKYETFLPIWQIFPDAKEYSTKDLYSPHPTRPNLWRPEGRTDDMIVFVNGEKLNPVIFEDHIKSIPQVSAALIVGNGSFEAALILETEPALTSSAQKAAFIEENWSVVEAANQDAPAQGRVSKSRIMFASPEQPMPRAGKGTVQRKAAIAMLKADIDALYADDKTLSQQHDGILVIAGKDLPSLSAEIVKYVRSALRCLTIGPDDDFFTHGMDSLQILNMSRKFDGLSPSMIYSNPTASGVARCLLLGHEQRENCAKREIDLAAAEMKAVFEKYSAPLSDSPAAEGQSVILTGSSGQLGSYILEVLMQNAHVSGITCLNRTAGTERQSEVNQSRGLSTTFDTARVRFLSADLTKRKFALSDTEYHRLLATTTLIIHNAWSVDFNMPLSSFAPQIAGVRALAELAARSVSRASLFFVSSIASVSNHEGQLPSLLPVPEQFFTLDHSLPAPTGYARSKHIAEAVLGEFTDQIHIGICRVGQISGPVPSEKSVTGTWKKSEWLPSLVLSSKYLGCLPESLGAVSSHFQPDPEGGVVDWVPIDRTADVIVDLALSLSIRPKKKADIINGCRPQLWQPAETENKTACQDMPKVFHVTNPSTSSWAKDILPSILQELNQENDQSQPAIRVVPYASWLSRLRDSATETFERQEVDLNPALKLLPFYEGLRVGSSGSEHSSDWSHDFSNQCRDWNKGALPTLDTMKTQKVSQSLRDMPRIEGKWMKSWIKGWI